MSLMIEDPIYIVKSQNSKKHVRPSNHSMVAEVNMFFYVIQLY